MKSLSTILLIIALLLIPAAILLEKNEFKLWNERLYIPDFTQEPNRHTPVNPLGTFLPPTITKNTTYTAADNPIIITGNVEVPAQISLTFEAGARVFVHEHGGLLVTGSIKVTGSDSTQVIFTTNEEHIDNRSWNGITLNRNARASITNAEIRYGTPGISCLSGSHATISNTKFEFGNLGLYTESSNCILRDSIISHVRDGVIAVGTEPQVFTTKISAKNKEIQTYESPNLVPDNE